MGENPPRDPGADPPPEAPKPREYEVGGAHGDTDLAAMLRQRDERLAAESAQSKADPLGIGQPPSPNDPLHELAEAYTPTQRPEDEANLPPIGTFARALRHIAPPAKPKPSLAPLPLPTTIEPEAERHRQVVALGVGSLFMGAGLGGLITLIVVAGRPTASLWDSAYWGTLWFPGLVAICIALMLVGAFALLSIPRPLPTTVARWTLTVLLATGIGGVTILHVRLDAAHKAPPSTALQGASAGARPGFTPSARRSGFSRSTSTMTEPTPRIVYITPPPAPLTAPRPATLAPYQPNLVAAIGGTVLFGSSEPGQTLVIAPVELSNRGAPVAINHWQLWISSSGHDVKAVSYAPRQPTRYPAADGSSIVYGMDDLISTRTALKGRLQTGDIIKGVVMGQFPLTESEVTKNIKTLNVRFDDAFGNHYVAKARRMVPGGYLQTVPGVGVPQ